MNEERFRWGWRVLWKLWRSEHNHCLVRGCGRDTLAYWVRRVCNVVEHPSFWRAVLKEAVRRGWAVETQELMTHSTPRVGGPTLGPRRYNFHCVTSNRKPVRR